MALLHRMHPVLRHFSQYVKKRPRYSITCGSVHLMASPKTFFRSRAGLPKSPPSSKCLSSPSLRGLLQRSLLFSLGNSLGPGLKFLFIYIHIDDRNCLKIIHSIGTKDIRMPRNILAIFSGKRVLLKHRGGT